ncbi:MAG: flagellar biosynthesis protein FlhF [Nitrospirota bacterium]|nr:flagellar biosynthesis protein FlhF [Nitrospirota bacterium]MDH5775458.1 flagellar biosynthesis protein FlhF [Nitrospirota bacterium]
MKLKRFEALSLQEALQAVKAELGPEAVIVSSRRIQKSGGLFGLLSQSVIEVTAAVDRAPQIEDDQPAVTIDRSLQALIKKQLPTAGHSSAPPKTKKEATFSEQLQVASVLDPVTQHLHDMREEIQRLRESQKDPEQTLGPLRQEIEGLRIVVGEVLESQLHKRVEGLPGDVLGDYQALVGHGINPQVAHGVLRSVVETLGTVGLGNRDAVNELMRERLEEGLVVSNPSVSRQYGQKIMMLVGPTGVGKTTTIAKLAGLARQQDEHQRTVLITLDTYRVAAVEQLRVFAKILKIPLEVAVSQQDFSSCVRRHQEADLILIDTAGRSPKDRAGHEELVAMTRGVGKIETHLVLAAPMSEAVQMDTIRRYQSLPIQKLIMTKLDEALKFGSMYTLLSQAGLPVSYLSAGQRVPEDLEVATRQRLVDLVLSGQPGLMSAEPSVLAEVAR